MKIIEVPLFNDDGSIKATFMIGPKEAQFLLEFAVKFLAGVGVHTIMTPESTAEETKPTLND